VAERVELRPSVARMACSDVMRARCGDKKVSGRRLAGAHGGSRSRESETSEHASSTRSLPNHATSRAPQGATNGAPLAASVLATDRHGDAPPRADEGATSRAALHRALGSYESRLRHSAMTIACEDPRVRECDLIMCCVASPPRCRAIGIVSPRRAIGEGSACWLTEPARRKGRRHSRPG
jgi:hypothetical protein